MDHALARNVPGEALDAAVDAHLDRAIALLQELVRAESTLGREAAAQETLAVALADLGFTVEWLPITPAIAGDPAAGVPTPVPGERRVLVARLTGTGAGDGRSLLLNGHLDVVPPGDPDRWAHPPFAGERAGGWLYGRGAGDMKAGWAMAVLATRAMLDAAGPPAADLTAAGVIEEENTGNGTLASVRAGVLADAVLLPEPTDLDLLVAGVGVLWVEVRVQGRQGHALATRDGVSAIDGAWAVVQALRALGDAFNEGLDEPRYFVNVGTFEAGDWTSSVPGSARLGVRIGLPPGLSPADAEAAVRDAVRDAVVADPWLAEHPPEVRASGLRAEAYALEPDAELVAALTAAHVDAHGRAPRVVETTGTTDARFYLNQAGVPALCFGPRVRDMHGVDERVELASIRDGARTLARFMTAWLGAG